MWIYDLRYRSPYMSYNFHAGRWKLVSLMTITILHVCITTLSRTEVSTNSTWDLGAADSSVAIPYSYFQTCFAGTVVDAASLLCRSYATTARDSVMLASTRSRQMS